MGLVLMKAVSKSFVKASGARWAICCGTKMMVTLSAINWGMQRAQNWSTINCLSPDRASFGLIAFSARDRNVL